MQKNYTSLSREQLLACKGALEEEYQGYVKKNLKLDMSRGKPAGTQLDLTNGILFTLSNYITEDGIDARNYGGLDGIPEAKRLFFRAAEYSERKNYYRRQFQLELDVRCYCAF